jgi:hypothetical protein
MLTALEVTLLLLAASILSVLVLRRLGMPPLVAYLLVGVVLGPFAANLSGSSGAMHNLAELGVVFLMFTLGLEFNLPKLSAMRRFVFGLGSAQVIATIAVVVLGWKLLSLLGLSALVPSEIDWRGALALGGALGGYVAGPQPVIDLLRQRARPYLFSNALPPAIVAAALAALDLVEAADDLRAQLFANAAYWRAGLADAGFTLLPGEHPIIPVMLGEARLAQAMAADLNARGIHVSGFFFPVVPKGKARIRTQMNARLTRNDLDFALEAFRAAGHATGVLA